MTLVYEKINGLMQNRTLRSTKGSDLAITNLVSLIANYENPKRFLQIEKEEMINEQGQKRITGIEIRSTDGIIRCCIKYLPRSSATPLFEPGVQVFLDFNSSTEEDKKEYLDLVHIIRKEYKKKYFVY